MKKIYILLGMLYAMHLRAQELDSIPKNEVDYALGKGLTFDFENQKYRFRIGGFVQALYAYDKTTTQPATSRFFVNRAYLSLAGRAVKEKVGFLLQTDFRLNNPLLDAWVGYYPTSNLTIAFGQKRSPLNNREMLLNEDHFQLTDRSLLSSTFAGTGREFGLFVEGRYRVGAVGIAPQLALTSGDGRNSFGADSRDADKGGLKYGIRMDVYPWGYFSQNNDLFLADLMHEQTFKLVIGAAASNNSGASHRTGEGHGEFAFYNSERREQLPDYRKIYIDLVSKYRGFSFVAEYVNTSAAGLNGLYTDQEASKLLQPRQISSYLILGDAYNFQTAYVTKKGYALDLRYTTMKPEFDSVFDGLLQSTKSYTLGLTKYIQGNDLKIQTAFSRIDRPGNKSYAGEIVVQLVF